MLGALDDAEQREVLESWNRQTLLVMPEACANCLLGPDPLVDPATIKSILAQCTERVFTCHLTTIAGLYAQNQAVLAMEIGHLLGLRHTARGFMSQGAIGAGESMRTINRSQRRTMRRNAWLWAG